MRVLITGANGYIGHHVVKVACDYNKFTVTAVDFNSDKIDPRADFLNINVLDNPDDEHLYERLGKPDYIIHLAWRDGFNHNSDRHLKNLYSHYAFIRNMINNGCKNLSIMGSMHEIGYWVGEVNSDTPCNPLSAYGVAKNALRQMVLTYADGKEVNINWLRAFYIIGDDENNSSIFSKILNLAKQGNRTFPFVSGDNKYDFINIELLSSQIFYATIQNKVHGIINCCSGKAESLKDIVNNFIKNNSLDIVPEYGKYPSRKYDSPAIWGNTDLISIIMSGLK